MKAYLVSILPYLAGLALLGLYVLLVGGAHVLAVYLLGPVFPTRFPRLANWMKSTGIDFSSALLTFAAVVPKPVTILGSKPVPMDPCMNVIPSPKSSPKVPPVAGLTLSLSLLVLGPALLLAPLASCNSLPPANPTLTIGVIDTGCKLIGIADPQGAPVAAVCESLAPVLGPWIAEAINQLEKAGAKGQVAAPSYVVLTRGDKVLGWARADVAPAVQAKIDAAP